jgi:twinkle protein
MLAKDLSVMLAQKAPEIAQMLLPNGRKVNNEWCAGSLDGDGGKSLKVHLNGSKAGVWSDFATGEGGDLLDLWAIRHSITLPEAMKQVAHFFNVSTPKPEYGAGKKKFTRPNPSGALKLSLQSPVHEYLTLKRGLTAETITTFNIPQSDDEIIFNYYRDNTLIFVKTLKLERKNDAKQMYVSPNAEPCLYGWQAIPSNAREIVICEGEIDAMTFHQYGIPALSVPFGGGKGDKQRWIEYEYDNLNRFDEIFVCMDDDEAGHAGAKEIIERLGAHRCRLVDLPLKDANECLVNGIHADDMAYFIRESRTLDPDELKRHHEFTDEAYELIHPTPGKFLGYTLGFDKCSENILFRPSGLSMWTGYNGHGKTLFLGQVMLNMLRQGARMCVASMELYPAEFMARTYIQATAQETPSRKFIEAINSWLEDRLFLFNLVGTGKIERLLDVFLYARRRYGVDVFIVDSLTTLNIAEDDYNGQKALTEMLRDFKLQHQCHIHLVAHPRKPRDEKEIPGKYDIRGGGAISDLADNCFSIWRNKEKEDLARRQTRGDFMKADELEKLQKPDSYLKCDKNRHGRGKFKEGIFGFWFNEPSFQYLEREGIRPKPFVEYSCLDQN